MSAMLPHSASATIPTHSWRQALPGAEHWQAAATAAQLREEQVALIAAVVRVIAPRVAAADRRCQEVAEAAGALGDGTALCLMHTDVLCVLAC